MADVIAETPVDGAKEDSSPEKLKEVANDVVDKEEDDIENDEEEPSVKKAKLAKENSVNDTKATQGNAKPARNSKGSTKRLSTMNKVAKEAEALLKEMGHKDENPEGDRRRTRSQTRGTPPRAAAPARHETAKKSRRGRPKKEEKVEKEEEEEEVEKESEEKEKDEDETVKPAMNNTGDKHEDSEQQEEEEEESTENKVNDDTGESLQDGESEPVDEEAA